jgi:hypothetical protein
MAIDAALAALLAVRVCFVWLLAILLNIACFVDYAFLNSVREVDTGD